MRKVAIADATEQELREFASKNLGIEIRADAKYETVLSKVRKAHNKPDILLDDIEETTEPAPAPALVKQAANNEEKDPNKIMRRIQIGISDGPGGEEPVPCGLNGRMMLIPRDEVVEISEARLQILQRAVRLEYRMEPDGERIDPTPVHRPMYPITYLS